MSLLDDIAARVQAQVAQRRTRLPLEELRKRVADAPPVRSLGKALRNRPFSIIGEIKERSPSSGCMDARNVKRALQVYNNCSAISAISVLTEPEFFGGSIERLQRTRSRTTKPVLRKDFIFDEYQVWEARAFGADAVLLMAALHRGNSERLKDLHGLAHSLRLEVLVEVGMSSRPEELAEIVPVNAQIWGINSRRFQTTPLKFRMRLSRILGRALRRDFTTATSSHRTLRKLIPSGRIAVAESGLQAPYELDDLWKCNYRAALIGTAFLRGPERIESVVEGFAKRIAKFRASPAGDPASEPALSHA